MSDTETLRKVIHERHRVRCMYIRTDGVHDGSCIRRVEVFACTDDPAMLVFAWAEMMPDGGHHYVTVLGKPPVWNARAAVHAHVGRRRDSTAPLGNS
jgi:hypothetical protein